MAKRRETNQTRGSKVILPVGALAAAGLISYAALQFLPTSPTPNNSRDGKVPIAIAQNDLKAFETLESEDVVNPALPEEDSYAWVGRAFFEEHPEWVFPDGRQISADDIIGRVLSRDIKAGSPFEVADFLPEGSRTGITGGIPTGKQGFFLDSQDIPGLRFLKKGDRFDLLANPAENEEIPTIEYGILLGGIKARAGKPLPLNGVQILVQDAELIALATNSRMTTRGGLTLSTENSRVAADIKQERVMIAIDPLEAIPLTKALGDKSRIHMVTRSGQAVEKVAVKDPLEGLIPVASNSISIEPFQSIRASDLSDGDTGELRQYYFKPEDVRESWLRNADQLIGRVVKKRMEPGYIFSEEDFLGDGTLITDVKAYDAIDPDSLVDGTKSEWVARVAARDLRAGRTIQEGDLFPPGTPAGIAAAIPKNRLAMTIDLATVRGSVDLKRGDYFDLLCTDTANLAESLQGVEVSPELSGNLNGSQINRVIANMALVIQTMETHLVVAVKPSEVSEVAKAIASQAMVYCVTRGENSKLDGTAESADSDSAELTSDPNPLDQISTTETLIGGERVIRAYGGSK